jgi:superfamily II DNA helicase RecQ
MLLPGCAIIVSPLIALMKNQVDLVRGYSSNDDVAHFLNSTLTKKEIKEGELTAEEKQKAIDDSYELVQNDLQ